MGKSLTQTIYQLIIKKHPKLMKVKSEFRVPDQRFAWIRLRALCDIGNYEALETSRKPVIGFVPYVEQCFSHGNILEASIKI